jgi:ribosome-binding protein aMBF1 (putative translation factor)
MNLVNDILRRIDASMARHGWSANRWGREVLNNPNAIYDYRSGKRSPNARTLERIGRWLDLDETAPVDAARPKALEAERSEDAEDMLK